MPLAPKIPLVLEQRQDWRTRLRVEIKGDKVESSLNTGAKETHTSFHRLSFAPYYDEIRHYPEGWVLLLGLLAIGLMPAVVIRALDSLELPETLRPFLKFGLPIALGGIGFMFYRKAAYNLFLLYAGGMEPALKIRVDMPTPDAALEFVQELLAPARTEYTEWLANGPREEMATPAAEIEQFHRLKTQGVLTEDEFQMKKTSLLKVFLRG